MLVLSGTLPSTVCLEPVELSPPNDQADAPTVQLADDFASALDRFPDYRKAFEALSPQEKHDLIRWIESARDPEHRRRRLDMIVRSLR